MHRLSPIALRRTWMRR